MHYEESKLSINGIKRSLDQIISYFGEQFLKATSYEEKKSDINHNRKRYSHLTTQKTHPLLSLWRKGYSNYLKLNRRTLKYSAVVLHYSLNIPMSKELLELVDIGNHLREIKTIPIINEKGERIQIDANKRWNNRLTNPRDFEKAIYEIKVASSLKKARCNVSFIEEGIGKTADLLIEKNGEKVYVECKKKDKKTQRDQYNENIWNNVLVRLLKSMDRAKKNFAIVVKTNSDFKKKGGQRSHQIFKRFNR